MGGSDDERYARAIADRRAKVDARETLRKRIEAAVPGGSDPATRNISIKITTIQSSKGLAEDYVFIADFDDRFFLEKEQKCSDQKNL
jgi:superfamily I DNA/RNA helicase